MKITPEKIEKLTTSVKIVENSVKKFFTQVQIKYEPMPVGVIGFSDYRWVQPYGEILTAQMKAFESYEKWYSIAQAIVSKLYPNRNSDFNGLYEENKKILDLKEKIWDNDKLKFQNNFLKNLSRQKSILSSLKDLVDEDSVEVKIDVKNENKGPSITSVSSDKIKGNFFGGKTHIGPNFENVQNNSTNFEAHSKDFTFIENASKIIINKYGERKPIIVSIFSFLIGSLSFLSGIGSLLENTNQYLSWIKWFAFLPQNLGIVLVVLGILLIIFGSFLIKVVKYKNESRCPKCNEFYAWHPSGDSEIKDTPTYEGIRRTIKTPYTCKECEHSEIVTKHKLLEVTNKN